MECRTAVNDELKSLCKQQIKEPSKIVIGEIAGPPESLLR
jgi:hypothetical protein